MSRVVHFNEDAELGREAIQGRVFARVATRLAPRGWQAWVDGEDPNQWRLVREHGAVRQQLRFGAYVPRGTWVVLTTDPDPQTASEVEAKAQVRVDLGFSSDAIAMALNRMLPEDAACLEAARDAAGRLHNDISLALEQVERYRWKCGYYREHPEEFDSPPSEVVENAIVERLIERLRRGRPPNT